MPKLVLQFRPNYGPAFSLKNVLIFTFSEESVWYHSGQSYMFCYNKMYHWGFDITLILACWLLLFFANLALVFILGGSWPFFKFKYLDMGCMHFSPFLAYRMNNNVDILYFLNTIIIISTAVPRISASLTNDLEMYREKVDTALRLIYILLIHSLIMVLH